MHLRKVTSRRNGKTYQYAQLVESFRREDGKPAVRVVCHLGMLPEPVFNAFKIALKAARKGEGLFLQSELAELLSGSTLANLRYLDIAVLRHFWQQWRLSEILDELAPEPKAKLALSEVILSLVLQRCCAPGSKLKATRWVPTTALPELLGFPPQAFENTRIHRALEKLYENTEPLQQKLVDAYLQRDSNFTVLFMDVTDTWFEGIGSPMAEQTRTKNETPNKRCLGIVMLVNERGYPLRWSVVGGKTKDWNAMRSLLRQIGSPSWLHETLIVFDRAMGQSASVAELKESGLHFLTAAHRTSIDSYTHEIPTAPLNELVLEGTDESYERDIKLAASAARQAGFHELHELLFVLDLGVQTPPDAASKYEIRERWRGQPNKVSANLQFGEAARGYQLQHPKATQQAIAEAFGVSVSRVRMSLALLRLAPAIHQQIREKGSHLAVPEAELQKLVRLEHDAQLVAFNQLLRQYQTQKAALKAQLREVHEDADGGLGELRMLAYFNPRLFVDMRQRGQAHCELLEQRVNEFNEELRNAKRSRERDTTYRKFTRELERLRYLDCFDISLEELTICSPGAKAITSFQGRLIRNEEVWVRRRKYDGLVLLLAHPRVPHSAAELVQRYRDKDRVEKGFQTIKSVCELRPLFHYTDPKVQAHVTLCMLALLLERSLEEALMNAGLPMSAPRCIELLQHSNLNLRVPQNASAVYDITRPEREQWAILDALGLRKLADDNHLRAQLTARPVSAG